MYVWWERTVMRVEPPSSRARATTAGSVVMALSLLNVSSTLIWMKPAISVCVWV